MVLKFNVNTNLILRLIRFKTERHADCLQDLHYDYDPIGNITSIKDKTQRPVFHSNQKIEANNVYEYDALYQLIAASGRENSGNTSENHALPERQLLNDFDKQQLYTYQRRYAYDKAGNILNIRHHGKKTYSINMKIDENSNRSLRKIDKSNNFDQSFDSNGNVLYLQAGQSAAFSWNQRNQLQKTILLARDGHTDDTETYNYDSQGQRQQKQRSWLAQNQRHTERVRYLPQLELRETWQENIDGSQKKSNQTLYLIPLYVGSVSVRLLHWEIGKPNNVDNNQQRYSIDNHLGSAQLEFDEKGQIISYEEYFPFGGTAIWACRNRQEAAYKYVKYSGKERDHSGLYYYGARYYIPWLGRWLNPDPAGIVDGLNLFCMTHNNPIVFTDQQGYQAKHFTALRRGLKRLQNFFAPTTAKNKVAPEISTFAAEPESAIYNKRSHTYFNVTTHETKDLLEFLTQPSADIYSRKETTIKSGVFSKLNAEEHTAIDLYSKGSAVFNSQSAQNKPVVKNLRTALAKIKPIEHIVTFRGSGALSEVWGNKIQVGDIITTGNRFTSTSMDFSISEKFAKSIKDSSQDKIIFIMDTISGKDVSEKSFYDH